MRRAKQPILVPVGAIRMCSFCFDLAAIVAVERATNGDPEYVCGECHRELRQALSSAFGGIRR